MVARSESWRRSAEPGRAALLAALAIALFLGAWAALHHGFYTRHLVEDTPVYERYGDAIARGEVPYRDFGVEYPPAALPAFALPALGHRGDFSSFRSTFEALMWACGALALLAVASVLAGLGVGAGRLAAALAFVALAPLALGPVVLSRFDLWPAALTVGARAALVAGRARLGLAVLALAVAAKVYPAVVLPLALVELWRARGRREALAALAVFVAVLALCFLPFLVLAPGGVWDSVVRQTSRPLQLESLGSAFLLAAHHLFGLRVAWRSGHGSQNLVGTGPDVVAAVQTVLQVGALVAVWALFARGPGGRERLVASSAAAVCAFVAFGKVLSPQFLIWLVPLVPLVRGRRGLAAAALLGAALGLTQGWFPYRYWKLVFHFDELASWLVLSRDLVLLGLLAVLAWPARREGAAGLGQPGT